VTFAGGRLAVWDLDSGTRLRELADAGPAYGSFNGARPEGGLVVTPDGRYVLLARGSLVTWDQETGDVRTVAANDATTLALASDRRVVTGSSHTNFDREPVPTNALRVFDIETGRLIHMLFGHPCGVNALAVSGDGRLVASAPNPGLYLYQDPCPRLWDVNTGEHLWKLDSHGHTVTAVAISPDGRHVVTGGGCCFQRYGTEFTVRVSNAETGELRGAIVDHTGPVTALLSTPDNRWAVSAGGLCPQGLAGEHGHYYTIHDGSIRLNDLDTATLAATFQADDAVTAMALAGPRTIVAGGLDGAVHILRIDGPSGPGAAS
jgi:WD40 repeat protein